MVSTWMISACFTQDGEKMGLFSPFWEKKEMDPGCAEDSEACLQSQPCVLKDEGKPTGKS